MSISLSQQLHSTSGRMYDTPSVDCADLTATNTSGAQAEGCYPYLASGKGSEGSAYLQFIIDEYDSGLPESTMFLHGHWYVVLT